MKAADFMDLEGATGLFGGTFDPPTIAHQVAAEWARDNLALKEVRLIPAWVNPLKEREASTDAATRLEFLRIAFQERPEFPIESLELERGGKSYTMETVEELKRREPATRFVLLQGTDSLLSLTRWHRYRDLLEAVPIVALTRPGFSPEEFDAGIREHIHILEMPNLDISATLVRERRRSGRSIRYLVPPEVEELIHRRGLYLS